MKTEEIEEALRTGKGSKDVLRFICAWINDEIECTDPYYGVACGECPACKIGKIKIEAIR